MTALLMLFERLLALANALTSGIFAAVDIALWRIQGRQHAGEPITAVPRWVPLVGAALSLAMVAAAIAS